MFIYFLNVSGEYVPIIRRNNCVYATLGTCYSVWINTVVSPDDGHIVAQNM